MLKDKLYTTREFTLTEGGIHAIVEIDPSNAIFEGHFPGNPILPGVCTVQIIRELLEEHLGKPALMIKASNIKYLGFISPVLTPVLTFDLRLQNPAPELYQCSATISADSSPLCSFKGEFKITPTTPTGW